MPMSAGPITPLRLPVDAGEAVRSPPSLFPDYSSTLLRSPVHARVPGFPIQRNASGVRYGRAQHLGHAGHTEPKDIELVQIFEKRVRLSRAGQWNK
jgi:hypothetical protein